MKILITVLAIMLFMQQCTEAQEKSTVKNLYIVQKDKKYGLIDETGKTILEPKYGFINQFANGYYYFYEDNNIGIIGSNGTLLAKPILIKDADIEGFSEGIFRISKTLHSDDFINLRPSGYTWYGYMDKDGKIIFEPQEDIRRSEDFSEGLACVGKGIDKPKYGYINTRGKLVIDYVYDEATSFKNGYAIVRKGNMITAIDKEQHILQSFTADKIKGINKQARIVIFIENKKQGFINFLSRKVIDPQYDELYICETGDVNNYLVLFKQKGKYGYLDVQGNIVTIAQFDEVYGFNNGGALVCINKQYGIIDTKGKIIIPPTIKSKIIWGDGIGIFQKHKYWGAIDSIGNIIIQPDNFVQLSSFKDGLACAIYYDQTNKGKDIIGCIIDKDKNVLYQTNKYKIEDNIGYGLFTIYSWNSKTKNLEYGLIDKTGKILIPLTANLKIENFSGPLAKVTIGYDSIGYIDKMGNYVWAPTK